jgi:aspartokinase
MVQKIVNDRVFVEEAMANGIVSFGSLARQLKPEIEEELGKDVKTYAIVMALRRYAETIKEKHKKIAFNYSSEILLKTDICDISVLGSPTLFNKLKKLYDMVNFENGDILNIIHGRREVSIVTNGRYKNKLTSFLKAEKILNVEENLVALTLAYAKGSMYTPGVIFNCVRNISWENINIFEVVSTNSELTFILAKNDAVKGYKALEKLVQKNRP